MQSPVPLVSRLMRQSHRWLSIAFVLAVAANLAVRLATSIEPPLALVYAPAAPLLLLMLSGLWLFAQPYLPRRSS